jgi:outer membrane protein assembly factor BamB
MTSKKLLTEVRKVKGHWIHDMKLITLMLLVGFILPASAQSHSLVKQWETEPALFSCESVCYSVQDQVLYVSNMGSSKSPSAKDGDGSIGKVGLDGRIIAAEWVKGLDAPKGLGLHVGNLYVADIDRVIVIDTARGVILQTISIEGAAGLNDVSVGHDGTVYVSDYDKGKIFALKDGKATVFLDNIKNPNGVLSYGKDFYVLAQGVLLKAQSDGTTKPVVTGFDISVDGIEHVKGDEFIVSCTKGIIYWVNAATGDKQTLLDQRATGVLSADIGIDVSKGFVYVPTLFTHKVIAYRLE